MVFALCLWVHVSQSWRITSEKEAYFFWLPFDLIALTNVVSNFSSEFSSGRAVAPECGRALLGLYAERTDYRLSATVPIFPMQNVPYDASGVMERPHVLSPTVAAFGRKTGSLIDCVR